MLLACRTGTLVLCVLLLIGTGCRYRQPEPAPEPVVVQPEPSAARPVIAELQRLFEDGRMYADIGYVEDARKLFDQAVDRAWRQPEPIRTDPEFVTFRQNLLRDIHRLEMDWLAKGDGFTETTVTEQPNPILAETEPTLTEQQAEQERKLVESEPVQSEFPIVINNQVLSYVNAYSTKLKPVISATLTRSGRYLPLFRQIFKEEGVPEELVYLPVVESGYRTFALSRARAKGIWQFMSGTARLEGLTIDWWVDERCDPEKATRAAAKHLKRLYDMFDDWYLALAAYNAGPGKINRAIRKGRTRDFWKLARKRWLLRRETKNYVPAFLAAVLIAKDPVRYGFNDIKPEPPLTFDTVTVDSCTDLRVIARLSGTTVDRIRELNPQLRRLTTPVSRKSFTIRVPSGTKDQFEKQFAALPENQRVTLRYHRVKSGQTLSQIARKYQTSVSAICKANHIRNRALIRAGKTLVIPIGQGHDYYPAAARDHTVRKLKYPRGKKLVHRVRRGDTLYGLALRYRTDVASIRKWNQLDGTLLRPGQKLTVYYARSVKKPTSPTRRTAPVPDGYHRVRSGDTLYSLARKYGVTVHQLKSWNELASNLIKPGDLIRVQNI